MVVRVARVCAVAVLCAPWLAGCWMGVGNFIMYRLVNFKI